MLGPSARGLSSVGMSFCPFQMSLLDPSDIPFVFPSKGNRRRTKGSRRAVCVMADEGDERDAVYVGYQERRTAGKKGKVLEYYLVEEGAQKKNYKNGGHRNHRVWRLQADNDWGHLPWRPNRTTVHGSRMTSKWNPVSLFVSCRYRACLRSDDGGRKSQMGKKPYVL